MASIEKQQELRPQPMEDFPDKSNQVDIVAGGSMARLENDMPKGYYYSPMFIGTYFACGFGLAGGVGAFALASPVLETINEDIGPSPNLTWVAITYVLLLAIGSTLVGRVTDIFGRRWFFVGGSLLAIIGNIVCATAQNIPVLIGGMTMVGAATAAQASFAFVLGELVPIKWRFLANSGLYLMGFPYNTFAAKIAIHFVTTPGQNWRWCFYITILVNGLSFLCWFFFYHPPTFHMLRRGESAKRLLKRFDYVGFALFSGGITLVILGLSWGGGLYAWKSGHVIATLVVGFLSLIAFVLWEALMPLQEPYVPLHLFLNTQYVAVVVSVTVVAMTYYGFSIIWPEMLAVLYPSSSNGLGWKSSAAAGFFTLGDFVGLAVASFIRHLRIYLVVCMTIGVILLGSVAVENPHNQTTTITLISLGCFFTGLVESVVLTMSGIAIKNQDDIGAAVGVAASLRSVGGTIASTIYTTILTNRLKKTIPALVPKAVVGAGLPVTSIPALLEALEGLIPTTEVPGATPKILEVATEAYRQASSQAYRTVFLVTIAFGVIAAVAVCFCPESDPATELIVAKGLHRRRDAKKLEAALIQE